jgi:hypothetical protein
LRLVGFIRPKHDYSMGYHEYKKIFLLHPGRRASIRHPPAPRAIPFSCGFAAIARNSDFRKRIGRSCGGVCCFENLPIAQWTPATAVGPFDSLSQASRRIARRVTTVTAVGDANANMHTQWRMVMTSIKTYDNWFIERPIDDRGERALLVALVAIVAAWSIAFLAGFCL